MHVILDVDVTIGRAKTKSTSKLLSGSKAETGNKSICCTVSAEWRNEARNIPFEFAKHAKIAMQEKAFYKQEIYCYSMVGMFLFLKSRLAFYQLTRSFANCFRCERFFFFLCFRVEDRSGISTRISAEVSTVMIANCETKRDSRASLF